jgi:hypothetical protein
VDRIELRRLAGLTYSTSITSDDLRERNSERAAESVARLNTPEVRAKLKKKRNVSPAGRQIQAAKLAAVRSPEQSRAALVKAREAQQAYIETVLPIEVAARDTATPHGNYRKYATYGCRCELCTAANTAYMRDYRKKKK